MHACMLRVRTCTDDSHNMIQPILSIPDWNGARHLDKASLDAREDLELERKYIHHGFAKQPGSSL